MLIGFGIDFDYKQSTFKLVIKKIVCAKNGCTFTIWFE